MAKDDDDGFLFIDQDALDKALVEQPGLFFKHSKRLANARLALDEAESNFDVVKADLSLAIRSKPAKYGLGDKVTEGSIAATLVTQEQYQDAQADVHTCKHTVAMLQGVVTALDHRKRALEKLVDLHGQDYFSSPRVKGEQAQASMERERMRSAVAKTRRKRDDD